MNVIGGLRKPLYRSGSGRLVWNERRDWTEKRRCKGFEQFARVQRQRPPEHTNCHPHNLSSKDPASQSSKWKFFVRFPHQYSVCIPCLLHTNHIPNLLYRHYRTEVKHLNSPARKEHTAGFRGEQRICVLARKQMKKPTWRVEDIIPGGCHGSSIFNAVFLYYCRRWRSLEVRPRNFPHGCWYKTRMKSRMSSWISLPL